MNYYELFEMPPRAAIDNTYVAKKYFELQKNYHPDFFTKGDEDEQEKALEYSAMINNALKTFKDKNEALAYYLKHINQLSEDEKYELDQDFLMEMMDINEAVSEGEFVQAKNQIDEYESNMDNRLNELIEHISDRIPTEPEAVEMKKIYFQKKYLKRILDRLND